MGTIILTLWPSLTLEFDPFFENFILAYNFWTVSARALMFHMSIPCDKTFSWIPLFFTLWPWPRSLTHFLKTLPLLITFEQWVLEHWYYTWVFLVTRPFCGWHYLWPCDLDLWVWPIFDNFTPAIYFLTVSARALMFHMSIPCDKTFSWIPLFLTLWPWSWSLTNFLKTLPLITFEQWVLELWCYTWVFLVTRPFYPVTLTLEFDLEHFLWWDLPTGIKIFVLVTFAIFSGFILMMQFIEKQHN